MFPKDPTGPVSCPSLHQQIPLETELCPTRDTWHALPVGPSPEVASENLQLLAQLPVPSEHVLTFLCLLLLCNQPQVPHGKPQLRGPWVMPRASLQPSAITRDYKMDPDPPHRPELSPGHKGGA